MLSSTPEIKNLSRIEEQYMEHKSLPIPPGRLIRPQRVTLSIEDKMAWSRRWNWLRRKKTLQEITLELPEEFVEFVKKLLI